MIDKLFKLGSRVKRSLGKGFMHSLLNAEPVSRTATSTSWNVLGRTLELGEEGLRVVGTGRTPGIGEMFGFTAGAVGTASLMYEGYQDTGITGSTERVLWEASMGAGAFAYGYKFNNAGNVIASTTKLGTAARLLGGASRFGMGAIGASVLGSVGGPIGTPLGMIGGYAGAAAGPWGAMALMGVGAAAGGAYLAGKGATSVLKAGYQHQQLKKDVHTSGSLAAFHTRGAHTMRARAVQAIHKSHLNARSALGQEASYMHYPSRSYNSRYRMV